jgi:hypothetical protein
MMQMTAQDFEREWDAAWKDFDRILADLGRSDGQLWEPDILAVFLDVPSLTIATLIPQARAAGLTGGFDLVEKVRSGVKRAMTRLRRAKVPESDRPLPLTFGLTEALLAWEWAEMEAVGEPTFNFFERIRDLRLRMPEVSFCERTVHMFCRRVPPPRIG